MREGILGVIGSFKYFRVGPFILEGVVGKTEVFPQSVCGRKTTKTSRKGNSSKAFSYRKI